MTLNIRQYRPEDREAIGRICLLTGDAGKDATGMYANDELLAYIYAYPYVDYAPDLAFVVEEEGGQAIGYILGTSDIREMAKWAASEWAPVYQQGLPVDSSWTEKDLEVRERGGDAASRVHAFVDEYPAEFHIDILPEAQGGGMGRKLVTTFAQALSERGVEKLAIGVSGQNEGGVAFYNRMGFHVVSDEPWGYVMGLNIPEFLAEQARRENR